MLTLNKIYELFIVKHFDFKGNDFVDSRYDNCKTIKSNI